MGPRQSVGYNSAVCGMSSNEIPRRPKRKGKYQLSVEKYATSKRKPHPNAYTFQKKLCVFKYMGSNAPNNFTRLDKDIVMRGLLPQILVSAKEADLRNEICEVMNNNTDLTHSPSLAPYGTKQYNLHVEYILGSLSALPCVYIGSAPMLIWSHP